MKPLRRVHQFQKFHHRVKIVQRFPYPHQHNIGNTFPRVQSRKNNLVKHFSRGQIPDFSRQRGRTKCTSHTTSRLCGNTYRTAMPVPHEHRFHTVSIGKTPEIFHRSIKRGHLFQHNFRRRKKTGLSKFFPQCAWKVAHCVKCADTFVHPLENLHGTVRRFPHRTQLFCQFRKRHGFYIRRRTGKRNIYRRGCLLWKSILLNVVHRHFSIRQI